VVSFSSSGFSSFLIDGLASGDVSNPVTLSGLA